MCPVYQVAGRFGAREECVCIGAWRKVAWNGLRSGDVGKPSKERV